MTNNGGVTLADVSVRPAQPADAEAIARIQLAAWRATLGEQVVDGLDADAVAETWRRAAGAAPDPRARVLVAVAGPTVVGFAACAPSSGSLRVPDGEAFDGERPAHGEPATGERPTGDHRDGEPSSDGGGWTAELLALEVAPDARRAGHGSRLLAAVADLARERGAHHLATWTVRSDAERTAFLEAAGLGEAGLRRRLDVPGGEVEEILLTAVLPAHGSAR
ncbi:GNAT family N-acetyltransferase [Miniimonas arenae]|uniref:GNAT family N-acetyltransferase n=1 Tax=Miniimonas arenae TaxID=676201 RepID=A0A5C5BFZ7_9MICO|nr:GNAT family N-acetyltransferase [Miniimonas arenae]